MAPNLKLLFLKRFNGDNIISVKFKKIPPQNITLCLKDLAQKAQEVGYHPEIILSGRRLNNTMAKIFSTEIIKIMCRKNLLKERAKILLLGVTFKENCPDIRNSRVIDLYNYLKEYNLNIDVVDPLADKNEIKKKYGINLYNKIPNKCIYEAIILAVAHKEFIEMDEELFNKNLDGTGIIFDLKSLFPKMKNCIRI